MRAIRQADTLMDGESSDTLGLDVSTPPGANELGHQLGHSNLYVKNLPANVDEPGLWQLFSRCGTIEAGWTCARLHSLGIFRSVQDGM